MNNTVNYKELFEEYVQTGLVIERFEPDEMTTLTVPLQAVKDFVENVIKVSTYLKAKGNPYRIRTGRYHTNKGAVPALEVSAVREAFENNQFVPKVLPFVVYANPENGQDLKQVYIDPQCVRPEGVLESHSNFSRQEFVDFMLRDHIDYEQVFSVFRAISESGASPAPQSVPSAAPQ